MNDKPNSVSSLLRWVTKNNGVAIQRSIVTVTKTEDGKVLRGKEVSELCKVQAGRSNGFYLQVGKGSSWVGLEDLDANLLFTDDCFVIFIYQDDSITVKTYRYTNELSDRFNVRMVLNCSVGDINHDNAVKALDSEEVLYCLKHEKRKTGIAKLKRHAKKLNLEV